MHLYRTNRRIEKKRGGKGKEGKGGGGKGGGGRRNQTDIGGGSQEKKTKKQ